MSPFTLPTLIVAKGICPKGGFAPRRKIACLQLVTEQLSDHVAYVINTSYFTGCPEPAAKKLVSLYMVKHSLIKNLFGTCAFVALAAGCSAPTAEQKASGEPFDPYENVNRSVHSFNTGVDRLLLRPASKGYVTIVPESMVQSFSDFSDNLSMPGNAVNAILQGDFRKAGNAVARFLLNSTIGFAGLADPATEFGLPDADTDFGETLHTWGVREGGFVMLPFLGPSTERDAVGTLVDFALNPLDYAVQDKAKNIGAYAEIVQRLGDRGQFSDTVDSILYDSADSYAQLRVIYLQNRRFELAGDEGQEYIDPYDDTFEDPYVDPYAE
jgi:phospholipid-binding lipoprotein MlaA